MSGEIQLYGDGSVPKSRRTVTPLGEIAFEATIHDNAVAYDLQRGGPLMLVVELKGQPVDFGRKMVLETENGTYSTLLRNQDPVDSQDKKCFGGWVWDAIEKYPEFSGLSGPWIKDGVLALFPPNEARLRSTKITFL